MSGFRLLHPRPVRNPHTHDPHGRLHCASMTRRCHCDCSASCWSCMLVLLILPRLLVPLTGRGCAECDSRTRMHAVATDPVTHHHLLPRIIPVPYISRQVPCVCMTFLTSHVLRSPSNADQHGAKVDNLIHKRNLYRNHFSIFGIYASFPLEVSFYSIVQSIYVHLPIR